MPPRIEVHGYAIVSRDDRIAGSDGLTPPALRNAADWAYFQRGLDRADLVALTGIKVDQAWRCECSLVGTCANEELAPHDEYERMLMDLMFLQGLALGQEERDDAVCIVV